MYSYEEIKNAVEVLHSGGVILYPTDTIWGIGCDATNSEAVKKIYSIKERSDSKSMLVLVENINMIGSYVKTVPEVAWELIDASVNPLTIIYPGAKNLAKNLISDDGSIGIRVVNDPFCEELIRKFRRPIVSTSANISGSVAPRFYDEIDTKIKEAVDHIVEWRQDDLQPRSASSIIKLEVNGVFSIIR